MERVILHCDANKYYASVEILDNPALRPYPVAVCGSQEDRHGIVLTANARVSQVDLSTRIGLSSTAIARRQKARQHWMPGGNMRVAIVNAFRPLRARLTTPCLTFPG